MFQAAYSKLSGRQTDGAQLMLPADEAGGRHDVLPTLNPRPHAQVFALPGLELLLCQELQDGLTFPWAWKPEQAQLLRAAAVAQDGQLAMVNALWSCLKI